MPLHYSGYIVVAKGKDGLIALAKEAILLPNLDGSWTLRRLLLGRPCYSTNIGPKGGVESAL